MRKLTFYIFVAVAWWGVSVGPSVAVAREHPSLKITRQQELATVNAIYEQIIVFAWETAEGDMKPYTNSIPGSVVGYAMVPIKGGEFTMGSPASEPSRSADEGPQHKIKVGPFWMQQCEVTWNQYQLFIFDLQHGKDPDHRGVDAVLEPSELIGFNIGANGCPAFGMTQHAANKYCQWLSAKTGHFYRLPTEAEWEYACRAGTTTAYSFGNDPTQLSDYAWFAKNSGDKHKKVGHKLPNPWGLYDMHGNVVEWCLDAYAADYYKQFKDVAVNPWNRGTPPPPPSTSTPPNIPAVSWHSAGKAYPQVVRGGGFDEEPDQLRSAARKLSDKTWKTSDPQLPKSVWYFTDGRNVGFRIVRPLKVPSATEMFEYWNNGVASEEGRH